MSRSRLRSPAVLPACLCGRRGQQSSFEAVVPVLRGRESQVLRRKCHVLDTRCEAHCLHTDPEAHCLDTQRVVHLRGRVNGPPSRPALHHGTPRPNVSCGPTPLPRPATSCPNLATSCLRADAPTTARGHAPHADHRRRTNPSCAGRHRSAPGITAHPAPMYRAGLRALWATHASPLPRPATSCPNLATSCLRADAPTTARGHAPHADHRRRTNPSCAGRHRGAPRTYASCGHWVMRA